MADYRAVSTEFTAVADAIRTKGGTSAQLTWPNGFVSAVQAIPTGAGVVQPLSVTQNGTYNPPSGVDGYAPVTVSVSGGGGNILTGSVAPSASLGNDGDIYKQTISIASGVNFVEYLESNGTQYIDTGIIADQDTDISCDIGWKGNDFIIGARNGNASAFIKSLFVVGGSSAGFGIAKTGTETRDFVVFKWTGYSTNERIQAKTERIVIPASQVGTGLFKNLSFNVSNGNHAPIGNHYDDFICDYSQILFGIKQGSTPNIAAAARIYRVTYFQLGAPIADYLPCLDGNGVACMWDNIAGEYVYNDGTGDFAYGSTVTPDPLDDVYYLKENGAWHVIQQ